MVAPLVPPLPTGYRSGTATAVLRPDIFRCRSASPNVTMPSSQPRARFLSVKPLALSPSPSIGPGPSRVPPSALFAKVQLGGSLSLPRRPRTLAGPPREATFHTPRPPRPCCPAWLSRPHPGILQIGGLESPKEHSGKEPSETPLSCAIFRQNSLAGNLACTCW